MEETLFHKENLLEASKHYFKLAPLLYGEKLLGGYRQNKDKVVLQQKIRQKARGGWALTEIRNYGMGLRFMLCIWVSDTAPSGRHVDIYWLKKKLFLRLERNYFTESSLFSISSRRARPIWTYCLGERYNSCSGVHMLHMVNKNERDSQPWRRVILRQNQLWVHSTSCLRRSLTTRDGVAFTKVWRLLEAISYIKTVLTHNWKQL